MKKMSVGSGGGLGSCKGVVNVNGPGVVGVPLSAPVPPRLSPAGSAPDVTAKVNGPAAAPEAVIIWP